MQILLRLNFLWLVFIWVAATMFAGCMQARPAREIEPSFYYWKSHLDLDEASVNLLRKLKVRRLYVKFFDVTWNNEKRQPAPIAVINFSNATSIYKEMQIVPTVFITNECIERMDTSQVYATAERIFRLISQICKSRNLSGIPEIQMDCDWNASTKDKYFALLETMRRFTHAAHMQLSATIRLYQCKYAQKTGVPPVDRGLLMCYNMGNLKDPSTDNSILETKELQKYTAGLSAYPLALDVALPLFNWKVLFRNNTYRGLISELPALSLVANPAVKVEGNRYTFLHDTVINGYELKAGDMLRDEQVTFDELIKAADDLSSKLKSGSLTVSLYHLDSITLSKYSLHELETVFDHLR